MRVLYISYDGVLEPIPQSQVIPYLKGLARRGVRLYWLSFDKKELFREVKSKKQTKEELLRAGIFWYSLPYHKGSSLWTKIFDIICGIFYVSVLTLKYRFNLIHARSEVSSVLASTVKKFFGVPFIYDRRGFMAEDYIEGGMWGSRDSLKYKLLCKIDVFLLKWAQTVVVLTRKIKDILITQYPFLNEKISVIPCCVDLDKFQIKDGQCLRNYLGLNGKFLFMYSGSMGTWYMFDEMLDFFAVAKPLIPNAHFFILTLSNKTHVLSRIKAKQLNEECFTVMGASPEDVQNYVSLADAAIIFIKPVFSKISSSPTKFAEFLACGVPVIINSGIGDTEEFILRNRVGSVVTTFSQGSYRAAVDSIVRLKAEEDELKFRCRQSATDYFSLKKGTASYFLVYRHITDGVPLAGRQDKATVPFVSIVFPNYNGGDFILKTINSLLNLNYPYSSSEIIVVDNGSTDKSRELIKSSFSEEIKKDRIKLIELPSNAGAPSAYNMGIRNADPRFQYILKMDNDLVLDKECLTALLEPFRMNGEVGITGGKVFYYNQRDRLHLIGSVIRPFYAGGRGVGKFRKDNKRFDRLIRMDAVNGCMMLIKKEVFKRIGFMDEVYFLYFDDIDFSLRAARAGFKQMYNYRALAYHNTSTPDKRFQSERWLLYAVYNSFYFMKKHYKGLEGFLFFVAIHFNLARYTLGVLSHNSFGSQGSRMLFTIFKAYNKGLCLLMHNTKEPAQE